ncbi:hypothetical protein L227DRAFT_622500 [Lentinus tigrinus ALCF2SS1-6]|uniref:Uncharacterized protein n=1 Tax=Lentinus tigrinus ALCF2SS1-6 TaxID=1328759 RepID=A0A5C2SE12_9APHY|nr:hypothetical protein L227DRAFT_622500 [Lentinus tigrinus ALCF2SS1-6]
MNLQTAARIYLGVFVVITAMNMSFIVYFINRLSRMLPPERAYTYVDDDFPSQLPVDLPTVGLVLESGHAHFSLHSDDDWGTLFPESSGFTDLGPNNRTFLVSFMHQLHCLDVFRVGFLTNRTGIAHHVEHCLRYMRQVVLCYADTTLEPAHTGQRDGQWKHAASGVGSVHRCKDWTALRTYLDNHPAGPAVAPETATTSYHR